MSNDKAIQAYKAARAAAFDLIKSLKNEVERHQPCDEATTWGHVGELSFINQRLLDVKASLGGVIR